MFTESILKSEGGWEICKQKQEADLAGVNVGLPNNVLI